MDKKSEFLDFINEITQDQQEYKPINKNEELYSTELKLFKEDPENYLKSTNAKDLVRTFVDFFKTTNQKYENELHKEHNYIYVHLDPLILKDEIDFKSFLDSLLYIGIGTSNRYEHHFKCYNSNKYNQAKLIYYNSLFKIKEGVVVVKFFDFVNRGMCECIEGAIINNIHLSNLLNKNNSAFYKWKEDINQQENNLISIYFINQIYLKFVADKQGLFGLKKFYKFE